MTSAARLVLSDARFAVEAHGEQLHGEAFRISWFAVVGLLRAVGHVLSTLDRNTSPEMRRSIDRHWSELQGSKPDPAIFWGFIEFERNRYLKNYEHGILRRRVFLSSDNKTPIALDLANSQAGMMVQVVSAGSLPNDVAHRSVVSTIADGPFAGRSERQVAVQALDWWSEYLDKVDYEANADA